MSGPIDYVRVHRVAAEAWPPKICTRTYPAQAASQTPGNRGFAFLGSRKIARRPEVATAQVCSLGDPHDVKEESRMPDPTK